MAIVDKEIAAEGFAAELRRIQAMLATGSFEPALEAMTEIAHAEFAENFIGGHDASGAAWPPRKHEYAWPILIKTGHLMRSSIDENEPGHVQSIGPRDMVTGTNVFYGGFHQYGTAKLPPRPFLEVSDKGVDAMEEVLVNFIQTAFFGG